MLRLSDLTRADLQDFADRLLAEGLDPSTIRNSLLPLRAIFRRAVARGEVAVNPTTGLELPAVRGRRERIASPAEASRPDRGAVPSGDRAMWATAFYAGLRLGELRALRWDDVDLAAGIIHVAPLVGSAARARSNPKSRAGVATSRSRPCSARTSPRTGSPQTERRSRLRPHRDRSVQSRDR